MLTHSRLLRKSVPLLLIPLTCQLCLAGWSFSLLIKAEEQAKRAARAHVVSESVSELVRNLSDITRVTDPTPGPLDTDYFLLKRNVQHALANLKRAAEPEDQALIGEVSAKTNDALAALEQARAGLGDLKELKARYKLMKVRGMSFLTEKLIPLSTEMKSLAQREPEVQDELRANSKLLLLSFVLLSVMITIGFGLFLGKEIVSRLRIMQDNCYRYASRLPLNRLVWGEDEISELDSVFHTMTVEVDEMRRRERALVENARALIFSLDSELVFDDVNAACEKMLGYTVEELHGKGIAEFIASDEVELMVEKLRAITREPAGENLSPAYKTAGFSASCETDGIEMETRLLKKDGTQTYVLFSAFWSTKQKVLFCIANDINERKQAQILKQELMQMVSHDLQTPLNTVKMFFEVMDLGVLGTINEKGQSMSLAAETSLDKMTKLIGDVLEMEKIESGTLFIEKEETSLEELFENVQNLISGASRAKRVTVVFESSTLTVFADKDRLEQILMNLVSNAIKFSPQDSVVSVAARQDGDCIEIAVIDNGRGIPEHMQRTIFDRFKQVELADGKKRKGSGLGLAICKALVELQGGEIAVASRPGKGSKFTVRIPNAKGF